MQTLTRSRASAEASARTPSKGRLRAGWVLSGITIAIDRDEEDAAASLLENDRILVHPGYFYDIAPDHLVMTFIDEPELVESHYKKIGGMCRNVQA